MEFLVGVETEFILLTSTDPISAVNDGPWSASRALLTGSVAEKCLENIVTALQYGGIDLLMYHSEAAPGQVRNHVLTTRVRLTYISIVQYEIITGPLPPLEAADAVVFTRETIVNIAANHGLHATFSPRVYSNTCNPSAFLFLRSNC